MRQLAVSICVIKQGDKYLLQKRGSDPKKGAAGKIGAFGGKIESDEKPVDAARREISEETSLNPDIDAIRHVASYEVVSDHQLEDVRVTIEAFEHLIDNDTELTAHEGEIASIAKHEIADMLDHMTPATRHYFENVVGA